MPSVGPCQRLHACGASLPSPARPTAGHLRPTSTQCASGVSHLPNIIVAPSCFPPISQNNEILVEFGSATRRTRCVLKIRNLSRFVV